MEQSHPPTLGSTNKTPLAPLFLSLEEQFLSEINVWRGDLPFLADQLHGKMEPLIDEESCHLTGLAGQISLQSSRPISNFSRMLRAATAADVSLTPLQHNIELNKVLSPLLESIHSSDPQEYQDAAKNIDILGLGDLLVAYRLENVSQSNTETLIIQFLIEEFLLEEEILDPNLDINIKKRDFSKKLYESDGGQLHRVVIFDHRIQTCIISSSEGTLGRKNLNILLTNKNIEGIANKFFEKEPKPLIQRTEGKWLPQKSFQPHKYEKYAYSSPPIYDMEQLGAFFKELDNNQDTRICIRDLKKYRTKHDIPIKDSTLRNLLNAANRRLKKNHNYMLNYNLDSPITLKDLRNEIRYQLKFTPQGQKIKHRAAYRVWCRLLKAGGYITPPQQNPDLQLLPIRTFNDKRTYKVPRSRSFAQHLCHKTEYPLKKQKVARYQRDPLLISQRPEGGVVLAKTINLIEDRPIKNFESDQDSSRFREDPIAASANSKIERFGKMKPTLTFTTKKVFEEGVRVSGLPELIARSEIHPIERFIPDNEQNSKQLVMDAIRDVTRTTITSEISIEARNLIKIDEVDLDEPSQPKDLEMRKTNASLFRKRASSAKPKAPQFDIKRSKYSSKLLRRNRPNSTLINNRNKNFVTSFKPINCEGLRVHTAKKHAKKEKAKHINWLNEDPDYILKGGNTKLDEPARFIVIFTKTHCLLLDPLQTFGHQQWRNAAWN